MLAQTNLGLLYLDGRGVPKDETTAEQFFQSAVEQGCSAAQNALAWTWVEQGIKLERAEQLVKQAISQEPANGAYVDTLGWIYFRQERFPEAVKQLRRAVELASEHPVIIDHLGDAYSKQGKYDLALRCWKRSLRLTRDPKLAEKIKKKVTP